MKKLPLLLTVLLAVPLMAVITNNVPISDMPVVTNVLDNAYFPLIQPYPGRTTNDNFRATTTSIFNGRGSGSFTNLTINNLTVVSNLFLTNVTVQEFSTTNIFNDTVTYITNSFLVISNTTVTINGTNVATINPTVGRVPYNVDGVNFGDSALFYIDPDTVGAAEVDAGLVAITNLANNTYLVTRTIGGIDGVITNGPAIGSFELWTNSAGYLQPFDLTQPLFWTNSVTWGPGTNNVMRGNGPQLTWTSTNVAAGGVTFKAVNGNNKYAIVGIDQDENAAFAASTGGLVKLEPNNGSLSYVFDTPGFWPTAGNPTLGLDGSATLWGDFFHQGNDRIYGFDSGGNYSRLNISHTGTNGAIVFDSQANGSAGLPVNFIFTNAVLQVNGWSTNGATTNILMAFGGTSASFPGLSSSGTGLRVRKADNSGYANLVGSIIQGESEVLTQVGSSGTYASAVGRIISNPATFTSAGTTTDPMFTNVVSAASLATVNEGLHFRISGITSADASSKQITVKFGATTVFDTSTVAFNNTSWVIDGVIVRIGSTSQRASVTFSSSSALLPASALYTTPSETLSSTINLVVSAGSNPSGNVMQTMFQIDYIK